MSEAENVSSGNLADTETVNTLLSLLIFSIN